MAAKLIVTLVLAVVLYKTSLGGNESEIKEAYRIGLIIDQVSANVDNSTLLVTNDPVMPLFYDAVSIENRLRATINFNNATMDIKSSTKNHVEITTTLVQGGDAEEMLEVLGRENETTKGRLVALVEAARCVATKCDQLYELLKQLPGVTLFSPCCYSVNKFDGIPKNDTNNNQLPKIIYNGLVPDAVANVALQLANRYHWRRFNFVVSPDWELLDHFVNKTFEYLKTQKTNVILSKTFYCSKKLADIGICDRNGQAERLIRNKATVTFLLLDNPVDMVDFVAEAGRSKAMFDNGKAFIYVSLTGMLTPILLQDDVHLLKFAPDGLMMLRQKKPVFKNFRTFSARGITNADIGSELFSDLRILSKAVEVFAENKHIFRGIADVFCGSSFTFSESPDAKVKYSLDCSVEALPAEIWNVKYDENQMGYVEMVFELLGESNLTITGQPHWLGTGLAAPVENECELEGGGFCPVALYVIVTPTVAGSVTFIAVTIFTGYYICKSSRKRKRRKEKLIFSAIADFDELKFREQELDDNMRNDSRVESACPSSVEPNDQSRVAEIEEQLKSGKKVGAELRGEHVLVSLMQKAFCVVDDALIREIVQIKSLRHSNINALVALTPDAYHVCALHEFCAKGTLSQVLARKTLQLNRLFKVSFINDIASGMEYLHQSSIGSHGQLSSQTVVVDARWFCKITDIPIATLKSIQSGHFSLATRFTVAERVPAEFKRRQSNSPDDGTYWTAPELLRIPENARPVRGSQKGDIYSYGIIVFEIACRKHPYAFDILPQEEILANVRRGSYPPFRPRCPIDKIPNDAEDLIELARLCWEEVSVFRPNFRRIGRILQKMSDGKKPEEQAIQRYQLLDKISKDISAKLVDEMIATMEHYAENLEATVESRTRELAAEERRADDLLSKMLPRSIIDELKRGRVVHPETYESVTIYFSDIVGFTKLAAASAALDVVNFLNDLYSEFDNVIDLYNVYKVETIGDAYMVASGLPIRNKTHAAEIATMSLDMLSRVTTFKIRHRPDQILQLRIGMHSGSVVAGVVGLTMPRYCLFGDTVNYASRMESSGLALRIHVSPESKALLDAAGGFHLEKRGFVKMKGKGSIETYHLVGKDGFTRPLPDLSLAASLAEHEFK